MRQGLRGTEMTPIARIAASVPKPAELLAAEAEVLALTGKMTDLSCRIAEIEKSLDTGRLMHRSMPIEAREKLYEEIVALRAEFAAGRRHQIDCSRTVSALLPFHGAKVRQALAAARANAARSAAASLTSARSAFADLWEISAAIERQGGSPPFVPPWPFAEEVHASVRVLVAQADSEVTASAVNEAA